MSACSAPVSGLGSAREQQGPESCSRSQGVGALTRLSGGRVVREGHARHTNLPGPPGPGILSPLVPSARLKPLPILTTVSPHQEPETTRVTSSSCQHPAVLPRRLGPTPPASQDPGLSGHPGRPETRLSHTCCSSLLITSWQHPCLLPGTQLTQPPFPTFSPQLTLPKPHTPSFKVTSLSPKPVFGLGVA